MSLFKQLGTATALFLLIMLATIMFQNFKASQAFIQNQLYANAEDTAASLALAIGGVAGNSSDANTSMQTMISAIFDRGYYESITLYDSDRRQLLQSKVDLQVKDVPQWFIDTIRLDAPAARSDINKGWENFGFIEVKSHVGHGYVQLWEIFFDLLKTFLLFSVIFLTLLAIMIRIILRPLYGIEKQAKAIQKHDFLINESRPFTSEFRHVVTAMNRMVGTVKEIFEKEAFALQKYHELLYTDSETSLSNRKYLLLKLTAFLDSQSELSSGSFALLSFNDLSKAKAKLGYKKYEAFLEAFATVLQDCTSHKSEHVAARMNDNDFALLFPGEALELSKTHTTDLLNKVNQLFETYDLSLDVKLYGGLVSFSANDTQKNLFAKADFQLAKAKMHSESTIAYTDEREDTALYLGKEEWIQMLNTSLETNMLTLASQKVITMSNEQELLHEEVYLRMIDTEGKVHSAGYFLPMLINLKLTDEVDKYVINLAMHHLKHNDTLKHIAININANFLKNPLNFEWLIDQLKQFDKEKAGRLSFETSKFALSNEIELFEKFSTRLQQLNAGFGIDNFSIGSEGLQFLQSIKPAYIKADKSFFFDLQASDNAGASDSFSILASSMGIKLIATNIESESELKRLTDIGIAYAQGSYIASPKLMERR